MRSFIFAVWVLGLAAGVAEAPAQDAAPDGEKLYNQFCTLCHGVGGSGSDLGSTLMAATVARKSTRELQITISEGRNDKGMPSFKRGFSQTEIAAVVQYLRKLQRQGSGAAAPPEEPAPEPQAADPMVTQEGEALFRGKARCVGCHTVFEAGGSIGPDLTKIGARLGSAKLYEAVAFPSNSIAPGYAAKLIETKSGQKIRGRFRRETDAIIQIQSPSGELWRTYFKRDFESIENDKKSLMPKGLLDRLGDVEKKDLLAYLASLK